MAVVTINNDPTYQVSNRFNVRAKDEALEGANWQKSVKEITKKPKKTSFFSKFRKPSQSRDPLGAIGKMFKKDKTEATSSWRDAFKL